MSRSFDIVRLHPVPEPFDYNNVRVVYVGTCTQTGIAFFCSLRTNYGVRVNPDGHKVLVQPTANSNENTKWGYDSKRKQRYLQFQHAFGWNKHILVAHAVYMAAGRTITEGHVLDHINGCTKDNRIDNLRCISPDINARDGGFLRKLRNKGLNPDRIDRTHLLRFFSRMALIRQTATAYRYYRLTRRDLTTILLSDNVSLSKYLSGLFGKPINF